MGDIGKINITILLSILLSFAAISPASASGRAIVLSRAPALQPAGGVDAPYGDRTVRVGGDWSYPPFEYLDEAGRPAGFNVDLIRGIAANVGLSVDITLSSWTAARSGLEDGSVDMLMGMYRSPDRERLADFSVPFIVNTYSAFALEGSGIESVEDLKGKRVAVQDGDLGHEFVVANALGTVVAVDAWVDLFYTLLAGDADCVVSSKIQAWRAIKDKGYTSIEEAGPPLFRAEYCMAVRKGDAELLALLNSGLSVLRSTGEYDELYRHWFGDGAGTDGAARLGVISAIVAAALVLIAAILVWTVTTRRTVRDKTAELTAELRKREDIQARLQEAMAAADAARVESERAEKEKSAFVAWVSHELRTPLQGILGAAELLGRTRLDDEQARTLSMAESSAQQLYRLLSDLLDVMGAEKGNLSIAPSEFSYGEFADWMESVLRPSAEERGLAFRFSASGEDRLLYADKNRIAQVAMNLCANAVKYTAHGEVALALALSEDGLYISVKDTGPGIADEARGRIFQPYYRAEGYGKATTSGLGLGLSIVKSVVDALGGSIRFETNPSIGTHFEVSLPVAAASSAGTAPKATPPSPEAAAPPERRGGKAVVAEDEAINRLYLKRILEAAAYEVSAAATGEAALAAAVSGEDWDFILMDVSMPRMDGLEATRRIREAEAAGGRARVPIIALTAHAYAEDREACVKAGMDGFLSKPFTESALWTEVRNTIVAVRAGAPGGP